MIPALIILAYFLIGLIAYTAVALYIYKTDGESVLLADNEKTVKPMLFFVFVAWPLMIPVFALVAFAIGMPHVLVKLFKFLKRVL
jgi:hypothetical protein